MTNRTNAPTKHQKGKRYALLVLLITGTYSTYANVRSGSINAEPIVTSVLPTVVFFLTVHLLSYFNPKSTFQRVLVYGGLGLVTSVAFGISGFHIWELTVRNGQMWYIALFYPFIVDVPSAIATAILVQRVPTSQTTTGRVARDPKTDIPAPTAPKSTTPRKRTTTAKSSVTV